MSWSDEESNEPGSSEDCNGPVSVPGQESEEIRNEGQWLENNRDITSSGPRHHIVARIRLHLTKRHYGDEVRTLPDLVVDTHSIDHLRTQILSSLHPELRQAIARDQNGKPISGPVPFPFPVRSGEQPGQEYWSRFEIVDSSGRRSRSLDDENLWGWIMHVLKNPSPVFELKVYRYDPRVIMLHSFDQE